MFETISKCISLSTLQLALTHSLMSLRLAAYQCIESVVLAHSKGVETEIELWQSAFAYALYASTENQDYTSSILQCLSAFLDRLSIADAEIIGDLKINQKEKTNSQQFAIDGESCHSKRNDGIARFQSFVVDFLIKDIVLKKGAYPGTCVEKEGFTLALLECILAYTTQDQSYSHDNIVAKNGVIFKRRRRPSEVNAMNNILAAILDREIFASLFALLHSMWDNTRTLSFRFLSKLVIASQSYAISLPVEFITEQSRRMTKFRAIYLASSPRQRESDTGARLLAFLYSTLDTAQARDDYLSELVEILESRLNSMKVKLAKILTGSYSDTDEQPQDGRDLPLAHGIIQGIRLAMEHNILLQKHKVLIAETLDQAFYEKMTISFCEAMRISLAVVADVRDGESLNGVEDILIGGDDAGDLRQKDSSGCTPLNVNTGAIGANGTFSSVDAKNQNDAEKRIAVQRVVVSRI